MDPCRIQGKGDGETLPSTSDDKLWKFPSVLKALLPRNTSPIPHPSDSLRLTSLGVGQAQICAYLNACTHKESIQLFFHV